MKKGAFIRDPSKAASFINCGNEVWDPALTTPKYQALWKGTKKFSISKKRPVKLE